MTEVTDNHNEGHDALQLISERRNEKPSVSKDRMHRSPSYRTTTASIPSYSAQQVEHEVFPTPSTLGAIKSLWTFRDRGWRGRVCLIRGAVRYE
jgi:hypothetical protein